MNNSKKWFMRRYGIIMLKVLFQQTWRSAAAKMYPNYTAMKTVKIQTILPFSLVPSIHDVNMFSLTEEPFLLFKTRMSDEHKLNQSFPSSEVKNVCRNEVMTPAWALDVAAVLVQRLPVNPGISPELTGAAGALGTRGNSLGMRPLWRCPSWAAAWCRRTILTSSFTRTSRHNGSTTDAHTHSVRTTGVRARARVCVCVVITQVNVWVRAPKGVSGNGINRCCVGADHNSGSALRAGEPHLELLLTSASARAPRSDRPTDDGLCRGLMDGWTITFIEENWKNGN